MKQDTTKHIWSHCKKDCRIRKCSILAWLYNDQLSALETEGGTWGYE